MKKILSLILAITASMTMTFAESLTVDCGTQVQITATPKTGYHFVRWNDNNTTNPRTVEASDITYTAYFEINTYTIRFLNGTEVLQSEELTHGSAVSYKGTQPTKASTAQYEYAFEGWSPTINTTAVADVDYIAQFTQSVRKYTITFQNWDGTVLQSSEWEYGTTPSYSGATPTRPDADGKHYTFTGWGVIATVTGEAVYVAQYSDSNLSYTITVNVATTGTGTVSGGGTFVYGTTTEVSATAADCYRFVRWNDGDTNATRTITVNGDATYTAIFEKIRYTVTVESADESMGTTTVTAVP